MQVVKRAVGTTLAQNYATYTYTLNGLPDTVKDAQNNLTTTRYDGHDRKLNTLYPDKVTPGVSSTTDYEQIGYDNNSNITSLRKRNGQSIILGYDNLNRLLSRTYPTAADNISFSYDLLGRRLTANKTGYPIDYAWDNAGRQTATIAGGKKLKYVYDEAGNLKRTVWPETPAFFITRTYDALNRPTTIAENALTGLARYAYDDLSRRATVTLGNGTTTTYGYNTQSALDSFTQNLAGTVQDNTWTYIRNQTQDIKAVSWTNDSYQWTGYTNGTTSYTANGLNQYATVAGSTLGYDDNANLQGDGVWSYGYDLDNHLTSASKTGLDATLAYDGAGRLNQTAIAGVVTNLSYDGNDLIAEYDSVGTLLRRYVHGPGVDEPLVWYEGATRTNKNWLYTDHQGSVVATADATGTSTATLSYGPYGEPNQTTGVRFRYTGQQLLGPLNLYYYKARFYSPAIGRFLQTDPIGYKDGLNLYAYVGNNPFNRNDPSGLSAAAATLLAGNYLTNNFGNSSTWAGQGAAYGAVAGGIVGAYSGGAGGGFGGSFVPVIGNIAGAYSGAVAGAIQGTGFGATAGAFLGAAAADLYYQAQSNDKSALIQENPRNLVPTQTKDQVSGSQIQKLANDMKQNGFDQNYPVDAWKNPNTGRLEIQDGHHRTAAAIKAGLDTIPVQVWE